MKQLQIIMEDSLLAPMSAAGGMSVKQASLFRKSKGRGIIRCAPGGEPANVLFLVVE